MFDQLVSEKTARKPLAVAVSLSGQVGLLGLTILFPLIHTAAITPERLTQYVPVLKPWGRPKPEVRRSTGDPARGKPRGDGFQGTRVCGAGGYSVAHRARG